MQFGDINNNTADVTQRVMPLDGISTEIIGVPIFSLFNAAVWLPCNHIPDPMKILTFAISSMYQYIFKCNQEMVSKCPEKKTFAFNSHGFLRCK